MPDTILTHEQTMAWIRHKGQWRRAKKTKEMWARATTAEEKDKDFHTAEGPVQRPQPGHWLCVGIVGEPWFQKKEKIDAKYELVRTETRRFGFDDRPFEYQVLKPKGDVANQVVQIKGDGITFFAFRPTYDNQEVILPAGAYVVTGDVADPRNDPLQDVWVVQQSIFESSYELI